MVYVENVTLRKVSTPEKLRAFLMQGLKHRHTGATSMSSAFSLSFLFLLLMFVNRNERLKFSIAPHLQHPHKE